MNKKVGEEVGKNAYVIIGKVKFEVLVKDIKNSYGKTRYLIAPIAGRGEMWTEKVSIIK